MNVQLLVLFCLCIIFHSPQYMSWNRVDHPLPDLLFNYLEPVPHEADRLSVIYDVDWDTESTTYDLTLKRLRPADSGEYVCSFIERVTNVAFTKSYYLTVEAPGKDIVCSLNSLPYFYCFLYLASLLNL